MFLNSPKYQLKRKQHGGMLLTAIFILTVMIFLAVSLQQVFQGSARSLAYEVFGTRALMAANTGAERVLQKLFNPIDQADEVPFATQEPAAETIQLGPLNFSGVQGLNGCEVMAIVSRFTISDSDYYYNYTHYRIESTATCEAGNFKTVRTVSVEGRER